MITLMDQKLSKLDDRLYELSSKMSTAKVEAPKVKEPEVKKEKKQSANSFTNTFNFEKPKETEPVTIPATKSRQSFELTTNKCFKKRTKIPTIWKRRKTSS